MSEIDSNAHPQPTPPQPLPTPPQTSANSLGVQVFRFIISGGISAVVDLGLMWILHLGVGWSVIPATTVGFICGTITAYLINRRWTFKAEPSWRRFTAVAILYALTYGINIGGRYSGERLFLRWDWTPWLALVVAFVISQGVATVINFIVQRTVIFKMR